MASVVGVRAAQIGGGSIEPEKPIEVKKSVRALTRSGDVIQCRGNRCDVDLYGFSVGAVSATDIGAGDTRTLTDIATIVSQNNHVTPLLPESLAPADKRSFDIQLDELIDQSKKYIFIQGYDLSREDLVDTLIAKAEAGVQVVAFFEPPSKEGDTKHELLQRLLEAGEKTGNLFVSVSTPVSRDQIMHVKRVIADTADDSIAEVSGGINFGSRASLNVDSAWRIEGVAALDSLRDLLLQFPSNHALPFDLSAIPSVEHVEKIARKRIEESGAEPVEIETARSGTRILGGAHSYPKKKFLERANRGDKLIISAAELNKKWVPSALEAAVQNGSLVKIVVPNGSRDEIAECTKAIEANEALLERLGLGVTHEGMTVVDASYKALVLRELNAAIEAKETIDVAAFAISDSDVLDRLVAAHEAGCRVRVMVDDTKMQGTLLNQRAIALLTAAGIEVRAFTDEVGKAMKLERNDEHHVKLHAKLIVIGGNRVLGGSANFTSQGLTENIEDGKLVRSRTVAEHFTNRLFEPIWENGLEVSKVTLVPHTDRTLAFDPFPRDATVAGSIFLVYDLETTGWRAEHDERILSLSAVAVRITEDGTLEEVASFDGYAKPGKDAVGGDFTIPWQVRAVHGLTQEVLEELGAKPIDNVLSGFMDFLKEIEGHGAPIVPVAHNARFDHAFLDHVLRRADIDVKMNGTSGRFRLPAANVDTLSLARTIDIDADGYSLDDLALRYKLIKKKRDKHRSLEDARLTAKIFARLVKDGGLVTISETMGDDRLLISDPIQLSVSPRNFTVRYELEKPKGGKLTVREMDRKSGAFGEDERVLDLELLGVVGENVEVRFFTADDEEGRTAYMRAKDAAFTETGRVYHALRDAGWTPEVNASKRPKRKREASAVRAKGAVREQLDAKEPANEDRESTSTKKKGQK